MEVVVGELKVRVWDEAVMRLRVSEGAVLKVARAQAREEIAEKERLKAVEAAGWLHPFLVSGTCALKGHFDLICTTYWGGQLQ